MDVATARKSVSSETIFPVILEFCASLPQVPVRGGTFIHVEPARNCHLLQVFP